MRFEITGLLIFPLKTKSAYFFFKNKKIQGPPGAEGPKGYNGPRGERGSPVCFNLTERFRITFTANGKRQLYHVNKFSLYLLLTVDYIYTQISGFRASFIHKNCFEQVLPAHVLI